MLVLSPHEEDHGMLSCVLRNIAWQVHHSYDLEGAGDCLREYPISVVLCDCFFQGRSWKDFLEQLSQHPNSPTLVVASDKADGRLSAEVLNLGGYDVLAKPFCFVRGDLGSRWRPPAVAVASHGVKTAQFASTDYVNRLGGKQ